MVLAHDLQKWLDKRREKREREAREKAYAEGYAEGRAKVKKQWRAWLARKEDAESRGENFTEPPPNGNPD